MAKKQQIELLSKVFWEGGLKTRATIRGFEVETDKPRTYYGTNLAPAPTEVFLSSIGACLMTTFIAAARRSHIVLEECTVGMHATYDGTDTKEALESADFEFTVWAKEEYKGRAKRCFDIARTTCPLTKVVKFPVNVTMKFIAEK